MSNFQNGCNNYCQHNYEHLNDSSSFSSTGVYPLLQKRWEILSKSLSYDFTHKLYSFRHGFRESWESVKFVKYWTIFATNLFHNTVMEPMKWVFAENELPTCSPLEDEVEVGGGALQS